MQFAHFSLDTKYIRLMDMGPEFTVVVHADNHIHDGMKCVVQNLLAAAEKGDIVLFCEGNVHEADHSMPRTIVSHTIEWTGVSPFINGVEDHVVSTTRLWANAARIAFSTGRDDDHKVRKAGREGIFAVRAILVALATAYHTGTAEDKGRIVQIAEENGMLQFMQELHSVLSAPETVASVTSNSNVLQGWKERQVYDETDNVAVGVGKWPAGNITFKDLQTICIHLMSMYEELSQHACLEDCMNHHHVVIRENTIAQNIKSTMKALQRDGLAAQIKGVHLVIGASHVPQIVTSSTLRALVLDQESFWEQQEQISSKRLCDMIPCKLAEDPFVAGV